MNKKSKLIASWIICPDGTMLPSFHRHDYRSHVTVDTMERYHPKGKKAPKESNTKAYYKWCLELKSRIVESRESSNDGGIDYNHRSGVYTSMDVYDTDSYEVIRRFVCRGGRGIDNKQPLTYIPLFRMNDEWLKAVIDYVDKNDIFFKYYKKEIAYRKKHNISIDR